jgi:hypothetical protein
VMNQRNVTNQNNLMICSESLPFWRGLAQYDFLLPMMLTSSNCLSDSLEPASRVSLAMRSRFGQ